jgi:deoxycytidylate deaminase
MHRTPRRALIGVLAAIPVAALSRPKLAQAQTSAPPPSGIKQPPTPSKAAFMARARELRDEAAALGDQPYGAVVVRNGLIVGEGRNRIVTLIDPTAHSELMAVRDAARRLGKPDLSDCEMYSSATPCPMCQGALYWSGIRRVYTDSTLEHGFAPKLGC